MEVLKWAVEQECISKRIDRYRFHDQSRYPPKSCELNQQWKTRTQEIDYSCL